MSRRRGKAAWRLAAAGLVVPLAIGVLVVAVISSILGGESQAACTTEEGGVVGSAGAAPAPAGMYAVPLHLAKGRWFEVGATEYGGPGDPSSGEYGAIPDPSQSYLPAHPDSYAELSVLASNPANGGNFTFADANALNELPYLTALRVRHDDREAVLEKRDVGYGQGPGQTIGDGEPYRLDLWWQVARQLGVSKSTVTIELAPESGASAVLGQTPTLEPDSNSQACPALGEAADAPLPLTSGTQTEMLPDGLAAAGRQAPAAVKAMVAAGNRLYGTSYLYGGAHGVSLNTLQPAYDCSSSVSYLLHAAGLLGQYAEVSGELADYGEPGPGKYVTVYANAEHVFIYVAGLRFDTVGAPYDTGPNASQEGPRWRVWPSVPDWSTWSVRHPPGL